MASSSTLDTTQKVFVGNTSTPVQETLVTEDIRKEEDNHSANEDATASILSSTQGQSRPLDQPQDPHNNNINSNTVTTEASRLVPAPDTAEFTNGEVKNKSGICRLIVGVISIIVMIVILLSITGALEAHYDSQIQYYKNFTCTNVYLILKRFDCNEKSCIKSSKIEVEGIRADKQGDMAQLFFIDCSNIDYSHNQNEDCRMDCGIPHDNLTITRLTSSNNTQECTLCTLPINQNAQCIQRCQFYVTSELVDSAAGSGLCVLGKGVSNGAGECQRTQIGLKVDFRYRERNLIILRSVCISAIGILIFALLVPVVILCCYRYCASAYKEYKTSITVESNSTEDNEAYRINITHQYNTMS